jgi:hypothetical protein
MGGRRHLVAGAAALAVAGGVAAVIVLVFSSGSQAAPTKAEYFARVARICAVYGPKLDRIAPPPDVSIPGEVVAPLKRVIPLLDAENAEVRALRPPPELTAKVEHWLALKDKVLATLRQTLRAAETPDISGSAVDYLRFLDQAQAAAKAGSEIGFPAVCSSSS